MQGRAAHVAGFVAGEENHGGSDLFRAAHTARRNHGNLLGNDLLRQISGHGGFNVARRHAVGRNPPRAQLLGYGFGHAEVYRHLQAALAGEPYSLVTAEEALDGIVLLHAIYESIETGQQVFVDDWKKFANVKLGHDTQ